VTFLNRQDKIIGIVIVRYWGEELIIENIMGYFRLGIAGITGLCHT
jgi:hypothetical protein